LAPPGNISPDRESYKGRLPSRFLAHPQYDKWFVRAQGGGVMMWEMADKSLKKKGKIVYL